MFGINIYVLFLFKFYEYFSKVRLIIERFVFNLFKNIDEVMLVEFLSVYIGGLSLVIKKNYRIVLFGFFSYIDK